MRIRITIANRFSGKIEGKGGGFVRKLDVFDLNVFQRSHIQQISFPEVFASAIGNDLWVLEIFIKAQGALKIIEHVVKVEVVAVNGDAQLFGIFLIGADTGNMLSRVISQIYIMPAVIRKAVSQNGVVAGDACTSK